MMNWWRCVGRMIGGGALTCYIYTSIQTFQTNVRSLFSLARDKSISPRISEIS